MKIEKGNIHTATSFPRKLFTWLRIRASQFFFLPFYFMSVALLRSKFPSDSRALFLCISGEFHESLGWKNTKVS